MPARPFWLMKDSRFFTAASSCSRASAGRLCRCCRSASVQRVRASATCRRTNLEAKRFDVWKKRCVWRGALPGMRAAVWDSTLLCIFMVPAGGIRARYSWER